MKKFILLILFLISFDIFAYDTLNHFNSIDYGEDINVYYFTDINQWYDERDEVCKKEVQTEFNTRDCFNYGPDEPEILSISKTGNYSVIMIVNKNGDWISANVWILENEQWNLYNYTWI